MMKTCKRGHPQTDANVRTYCYTYTTVRVCIPCRDIRSAARKAGRPKPPRPVVPLVEKLLRQSYPNPLTGCIVWGGATNKKHYGHIHHSDKWLYVHRVAYEYWCGPIPDGLTVDHLCWNTRCIAPDHAELVTKAENTRRMLMRRFRG